MEDFWRNKNKEHFNSVNHNTQRGETKIISSSTKGLAVIADTTPTVQQDEDFRSGWFYQNSIMSSKFNFYILDGNKEIFTLSQLYSFYSILSIDENLNAQSMPFWNVYTKMTGVNDAGSFYHSKLLYTMDYNNVHIGLSEKVLIYGKNKPEFKHPRWRSIQLKLLSTVGEGLETEEILSISLGSDSSAPQDGVKILVNEMGFECIKNTEKINRKIDLVF